MPFISLKYRPGLVRDTTNYTNKGGFYECDKVRFRSGSAEKIGGWLRYGLFTLIGTCRQMFNYVTTNSDNIMALGTDKKLYLEVGENLIDVTPLRVTLGTPATDDCFDTTSGSNLVNVNIASSNAVVNSYVTFSGAVGPVNGIPASELNTEHLIIAVTDASNFTIQVTTNATSTGSGGGSAISAAFQITIGTGTGALGYGWGAGTWSRGTWGSGAITPAVVAQTDWFMDNFDNDLIANIRNGAIYIWEYTGSFNTRAVLLSSVSGAADVPAQAMQILVSQNDKHLLAFGCTAYGGVDVDPLLIRWATQDDPTIWTPLVTNSAGFIRLSNGDRIKRALRTRQETLVWTESTLVSLQFLGTTDVFGIQELADNISLFGPRAVATMNNITYWMGLDKFYYYDGRVNTLPCTIRDYIFKDINYDQAEQVVCGTNEGWNEIWWFYPSAASNTNDRYVIFNFAEQIWYYGTIARTAWLDSPLRKYPQAVGGNIVYNHEQGLNDDTSPMSAFITSSDFDLTTEAGAGEQFMLTKRILPDVNFNGSTAASPEIYMTLKPRNFPGSSYETEPDLPIIETTVDQYTNQVFIRTRARQMGFKIGSEDLDVQWQLGTPRVEARPDGKR
jgi:hypothetical protein